MVNLEARQNLLSPSRSLAKQPLLLVTAFALHVSQGFEFPAAQALLPVLVPRAVFPNAVVVSATVRNAAIVSGPVLAGFAIEAA